MDAFARQLDRIRDIPVGAPVVAARPPAGGSAHPAAPERANPRPHDTGAAATADCNRSRNEKRPRAVSSGRGHDQEGTS